MCASVGRQVRANAVVMTTCKQTLDASDARAGTHAALDTRKQIDAGVAMARCPAHSHANDDKRSRLHSFVSPASASAWERQRLRR